MPPPDRTLITSAASGKKAAPKAPARRRPAPAPTAPPPSASTQATSVAPPIPPAPPPADDIAPVQHEIPPAREPEKPVSEPVREPEVEQVQPEPVSEPVEPPPISVPIAADKEPTPHLEPILSTPEPTQLVVDHVPQAEPENVKHVNDSAVETTPQNEDVAPVPEPVVATQTSTANETRSPARTLQERRLQEFRQVTSAHVLEAANAAASERAKRPAEEAPSAVLRAAKKPKRSSTRSNAKVTAAANGEDEAAQGESAASPTTAKAKSNRAKKAQTVEPAAESPAATRRSTRTKKSATKKSASTIVDSDDETEGVENAAAVEQEQQQDVEVEDAAEAESVRSKRKSRAKAKPRGPTKPKRTRKTRMPTVVEEIADIEADTEAQEAEAGDESDPELHEIDPNTLSMWDLSYDSRHGQMSERGKKMNEIDWDEVAAKRKLEANQIAAGDADQAAPEGTVASTEAKKGATEGQAEDDAEGEQNEPTASTSPAPDADGEIGFLLNEDGEIVVDASTVQVDRTAAAMAAAVEKPVEEVNDLTLQINRTSWINNNRRETTDRVPLWKWKSDPWSEEETDRFYDALRMFGTDFLVISKMFPGKTRRMIKSKFTREEKMDPTRITDSLLGKQTVRMDLNHYARETSRDITVYTKYDSLEHAQSVINESMKERQDAMTISLQQEAQHEAETREKEKQKEKGKAKRGPRKAKNTKVAGTFGGGGPEDGE